MGVEVADVESPQDGPLDLGPAFAADLVEIGVVPDVGHGAGEPAVAVQKRGGVGDGTPPVEIVLGIHRQVHTDVLAPVARGGTPGPGARDHQAGAGGQPMAQSVVDPDVGGVTEAQIVAVQDQKLGVGRVPQAFGERRHARDGSAYRCRDGPRLASAITGNG